MKYIFDTCSFRALQHFYPKIFTSIWEGLDDLVSKGDLLSTREVFNELQNQNVSTEIIQWSKNNKNIFLTPTVEEMQFVSQIFQVQHFQGLIGVQQRLKGTPVADPFVIACAKIHNATVVTEEGWDRNASSLTYKPNSPKIPFICNHFNIACTNLENFMIQQGWNF